MGSGDSPATRGRRVKHMRASEPGEFAAALGPVATGVRVESGGGGGFQAELYAAPLERLGLFTVRIQDAHVEREVAPYAAITVPVSGPLEFSRNREARKFHPGSAHILHTRDPLDLRIGPSSGLFVATFDGMWLDQTAWRLTEHPHYHDLHEDWRLDLRSPTGESFRHFLLA